MAPALRAILPLLVVLTPLAAAAEMRSVGVERANFRSGPSTQDEVIFAADRYYPVELVEQEGEWALVRDFEGDEAWVASWLLGETQTVAVSADVVNVREEPNTSGIVVHTAERGAAFLVVESKGPWVKVADVLGAVGWIHSSLLWGSTP